MQPFAPMQLPSKMVGRNNDYHLRVVSYCGDPESYRFERKVDDFLEDLYNVGAPGRPTIQTPLAFSGCRRSVHDGRQVALIEFQLSPSGVHHHFTLDKALADFCQRIFKPDAFSIARTLSSRSVLGLSAISRTFQRMWNDSLFRQISFETKEFLKRIEEGLNDEYLPDWAIASSFASFIGAIFFGSFTGDSTSTLGQIKAASIPACIAIASSILLKISEHIELANPDLQQKRWDISHKKFKEDMKRVMRTITQLTVSRGDNRSSDLLYADLCEYLYNAITAAAKTHIANKELLLAYLELHKKAHVSMMVNGVRTGVYLAGITSALSVTTTTALVPLSQWGLAEAAGLLFLGELPVVQSITLGFCPPLIPLAALSLGGAALCGWSRYQDKKKKELLEKKVEYHRKLKLFVLQAWYISHLTHKHLRLVHCTAADGGAVEFVNDGARLEWRDFIMNFNRAGGRTTSSLHLEPGHIKIFLDEQRRDFEEWDKNLAVHEAQIV